MSKSAPRLRHTKRIAYSSWHARAEKMARAAYGRYGHHDNVTLHTYDAHDYPVGYVGDLAKGDSTAVDVYVTEYGHQPTKIQRELNWEIAHFFTRNWRIYGIRYIIANGLINTFDGRGWRHYDHTKYKKFGDANMVTRRHFDHGHYGIKR